jgi:lipopolysaccharide/colanic/teichoic acid biosynthesis glycosyltransferase
LSHLRHDVLPVKTSPLDASVSLGERISLEEKVFKRMIAVERKRTERSQSPFVLMLMEINGNHEQDWIKEALKSVQSALLTACRDTDLVGWYKDGQVIGVMFTGLEIKSRSTILNAILSRVSTALQDELTFEQFSQVGITFHMFPDEWEEGDSGSPSNTVLYPDLTHQSKRQNFLLGVKRAIDLTLSVSMLIGISPLFLLIALVVKLSSRGPVFFRQDRVGQFGKTFTFLKFRSMYVNNDNAVHREYVTKLIAQGGKSAVQESSGSGVYKLTNDRRITRIGGFLRKTSLDELPQLINVIKGEMSLVGPRPPIPYELAAYQTWHRRRVLEVKPGITGLWQVMGRSTVRFDEMVRLDLRYATSWTPLLDLKILLMTPMAVIRGAGAY